MKWPFRRRHAASAPVTDKERRQRTDATRQASEIASLLRARGIVPCQADDGMGPGHALFMAEAIIDDDGPLDRDERAAERATRWIGYLQCMLVYEGISVLADERTRVRPTDGKPA